MIAQKILTRQNKLEKKEQTGGATFPDFRLDQKTTVIEIVCYLCKNRNLGKWNTIESPEINPCTSGCLTYDKEGKNI